MSEKKRIGIVGCGGIARAHMQGYQAQNAEIVSVFDVQADAAAKLAGEAGARVAASPAEMVKQDALDGVSICSPPSAHLDNCRPFLEAGIAVLCEKPLELNGERAALLAEQVRAGESMFMIAFCHRFHPAIVELKALLDKGVLGEPLLFRNIFGGYGELTGNHRARPELSGGGCLIDHCAHSVDLFRHLVGDPTHVQAMAGNILQDLPIEDFGMIHLGMDNRRFGEITASYSLKACGNWVELYGSEGRAVVSYWNAGHPDLSYKLADGDPVAVDCSKHPSRFIGEVHHFLECLRTRRRPQLSVMDGLWASRIGDAAYRSVASGQRVTLND